QVNDSMVGTGRQPGRPGQVTLPPDRTHPHPVGAKDIRLRIVADEDTGAWLDLKSPAGSMEYLWIRFAYPLLFRDQDMIDPLIEPRCLHFRPLGSNGPIGDDG